MTTDYPILLRNLSDRLQKFQSAPSHRHAKELHEWIKTTLAVQAINEDTLGQWIAQRMPLPEYWVTGFTAAVAKINALKQPVSNLDLLTILVQPAVYEFVLPQPSSLLSADEIKGICASKYKSTLETLVSWYAAAFGMGTSITDPGLFIEVVSTPAYQVLITRLLQTAKHLGSHYTLEQVMYNYLLSAQIVQTRINDTTWQEWFGSKPRQIATASPRSPRPLGMPLNSKTAGFFSSFGGVELSPLLR